jgi:hypothetical protein
MKKLQLVTLLKGVGNNFPTFYHPLPASKIASLTYIYKKTFPTMKRGHIGEVLDTFHEEIFNELLNNRNGVLLPKGMGKLFIITKEKSKVGIPMMSYILSIGEKIGIVGFTTDLNKKGFIDSSLWLFVLSDRKLRKVREKYKEDFMFYMNYFKINKRNNNIFDIDSKKPYISNIKETEDPLKGYNEFEI